MTAKTTRLLERVMSLTLLWIGFVSATNGIEDLSSIATPSDGFSNTSQIQAPQNGAQTRGLLLVPQITIEKGRYYNTVLSYSSLQITFVRSNFVWSSVRCYLWGSTNSRASLSDMELVRSWTSCDSPVNIHRFYFDGPYYFRVVGDLLYSSSNVMASSSWIIDREAPRTILSSSPAPCGTSSCRRFRFYAWDPNGDSRYECSVNHGDWSRCTSPFVIKAPANSNSKHTFRVRAIDRAGNVEFPPAMYSGTLDADMAATGTRSSNAVVSDHSADSPSVDDSGSSGNSSSMLVVFIVVPIVGVVAIPALIVLCRRVLLRRRMKAAQRYPSIDE